MGKNIPRRANGRNRNKRLHKNNLQRNTKNKKQQTNEKIQNRKENRKMSNNNTWMPEEGESLEGILVEKLENIGKYNSNLYKIKTNNKIVEVWGKKQLDSLMKLTEIGDKIIITYKGMEQANDFKMKKYELEIINGN